MVRPSPDAPAFLQCGAGQWRPLVPGDRTRTRTRRPRARAARCPPASLPTARPVPRPVRPSPRRASVAEQMAERPEAIDTQPLRPVRATVRHPCPGWRVVGRGALYSPPVHPQPAPGYAWGAPGLSRRHRYETSWPVSARSGRWDFRRQRCPAQLPLAAGASHPCRGGPVPQASWVATVRSTPRPSFRSSPAPPGPASLVTPSPQPAPFFLPSKLPGPCPIAPPHTHTHCRGHRQAPGQVH